MEIFYVNRDDIEITIFLTLFSIAFGIFYYLVLTSLYKLSFKPAWLLFVIPPVIVIITSLFDRGYVPLAALIHFPLLLLLMIVGGIYKSIREKESIIGILVILIGFPLIIITAPWGIILLFAYFIFRDIIKPSEKSIFYELQLVLPTSKIRSMAMGLVEVIGTTTMLEPVISRIKKEPCIGYLYKIDSIHEDDDGRNTYSNISKETVCNPFLISDDTGSTMVSGNHISFINLPESKHSYESNGKRYQLFLLLENMPILLIGKAINKNKKVSIEKDDGRNIFALSLFHSVNKWNIYRPLRKSLIRHIIILIALVTLVLMCDVNVVDDKVTVSIVSVYESLNFSEIFNLNF